MATEVLEPTTEQRLTHRAASIEEFWALPESVLLTEYINGEILMAPAPVPLHQFVLGNIFTALGNFARNNSLGTIFLSPVDVVLPSGDVVQPDVVFLTSRDAKRALAAKRVHATPPLLVEIISPGSITHDTLRKRNLYERNGVREYWIVDPAARTISQLVLRKKHYALTEHVEADAIRSAVLSGFEMNVGELLGLV
ncbi:MAG TPA: Uma2 family endonuclease [Pyrinomonadaceae bacterium]